MNKKLFLLFCIITSVSASDTEQHNMIGFENGTIRNKQTTEYSFCVNKIYDTTEDVWKENKELANTVRNLSNISFQNHFMQIKSYLQNSNRLNDNNVARDGWCVTERYNNSIMKVLSNIISTILSGQDSYQTTGGLSSIQMLQLNHPDQNKHRINFRKDGILYLPAYLTNESLAKLTTANYNYIILYNYIKKRLLNITNANGTFNVDNENIVINPKESSDMKKSWYFWDDNEALQHIEHEAGILQQYITENNINVDSQVISKAMSDSKRYLLATELHRYITVQNVLSKKVSTKRGRFGYTLSLIRTDPLSNSGVKIQSSSGRKFEQYDTNSPIEDLAKSAQRVWNGDYSYNFTFEDKECNKALSASIHGTFAGLSETSLYHPAISMPYASLHGEYFSRCTTGYEKKMNVQPKDKKRNTYTKLQNFSLSVIGGLPLEKVLVKRPTQYSVHKEETKSGKYIAMARFEPKDFIVQKQTDLYKPGKISTANCLIGNARMKTKDTLINGIQDNKRNNEEDAIKGKMRLLSTYDNDIWLKGNVYRDTYNTFTRKMQEVYEENNTGKTRLQIYNDVMNAIKSHDIDSPSYKDLLTKLNAERSTEMQAEDMHEETVKKLRKAILSPEISSREFFDDKYVELTANSYTWSYGQNLFYEDGGTCVIAPYEVDFKINIKDEKLVAVREKRCDRDDKIVKTLQGMLSERVEEIATTIFEQNKQK